MMRIPKSFYWYLNLIILCLFSLLFFTCNWKNRLQSGGVISEMVGREMAFRGLMPFNMPEGISSQSLLEHLGHKIVIYVDSSGCEDCNISNMLSVRGYQLELKHKQREDIPFIYIFNTQEVWALQERLRESGFSQYYFVDFENTFLSNNQIPPDRRFHTFLLKNNKIQVVGNPSTNEKIRNLYNHVLNIAP